MSSAPEVAKPSAAGATQQNEAGVTAVAAAAAATTAATTTSTPTKQGIAVKTEATPGVVAPLRQRNQQGAAAGATPLAGMAAGGDTKTEGAALLKGKTPPKPPEEFYKDLQLFHERRATPIMHVPKISGHEVDLYRLYTEVTERGGFLKVNMRDDWDEILPVLKCRDKCVNASAALKHIYRRCLEKYERLTFFGEDPDKMDVLEAVDASENIGRSRSRYPSTIHSSSGGGVNAVPMSYNYRQHHVNMERRRLHRLSLELYKPSSFEKLMLSLLSPLPNEQDFAINACTVMTNESKQILRIVDYPKLLDILCAHAGVFADYSLRQVFQHVYTTVRWHSLRGFWRDLLFDKLQILELYTDEQAVREAGLIADDDEQLAKQAARIAEEQEDGLLDCLHLGRSGGKQDYIGQRVHQVLNILRNLSFFDDNVKLLAHNKACMRLLVMGANVRWGSLHNMALDIAGNVASEVELLDPTLDEFSRCLMGTLCDGIEGPDRGVIINCLEILYKLCQRDGNAEPIHKCLSAQFYEALCRFLPLNDIMLLIFTLEAIYALSALGARSCHLLMQVRGLVDQLVSLITVEAQSYGPDGCILMRVVETVPGNMLPLVAQNIANLQNVAAIQKQHQQPQVTVLPPPVQPLPMPVPQLQLPEEAQLQLQQHHQQQQQQQQLQQKQQPQVQLPQQQQLQPKPQAPQPLQQQPAATPPPATPQMAQPSLPQPLNLPAEDEQYALSWLNATFEKANGHESHIEQQELYRMYLSHCQKSGKHSVVTHVHFPRLVRLIFQHGVGPLSARRPDGTELPGAYYVSIRLRAQPLPMQPVKIVMAGAPATQPKLATASGEAAAKQPAPASPAVASPDLLRKKIIKKVQPEEAAAVKVTTVADGGASAVKKMDTSTAVTPPSLVMQGSAVVQQAKLSQQTIITSSQSQEAAASSSPKPVGQMVSQQQQQQQQQPSTSLIKSLLATKCTQRQLKQKEGVTVAQPQLKIQQQQQQQQPIKVASTAISQLVNNPLMQHTPVKVGQTTIKPLHPPPATLLEKKPQAQLLEAPPPLAPLSGNNVAKDSSGRPVIIANQMLVEILDKKGADPPIHATLVKRKLEGDPEAAGGKRYALESVAVEGGGDQPVTPSKNAANLYAEMAASILEDEDLEDIPPLANATTATTTPSLVAPPEPPLQQQPQQQLSMVVPQLTTNVPRQLMFQHQAPQQLPQLKLTQGGLASPGPQQMSTAMATIKTDQGLQTVPVILQQKPMEQQQIMQHMMQGPPQPPQTQYVLATNQQGQTYLVAQQSTPHQVAAPPPPQPTQTVLVTQTPQQQSAGTKTIIILQQQTLQPAPVQQQPQKMIMTTAQGQQVLVTQRTGPVTGPQQTQQQIFINPQTGAATHIQHVPVSSVGTPTMQRQIMTQPSPAPSPQMATQTLQQSGQISPSLLSQLNHIPATIKLHQPQPQQLAGSTPHSQAQQQLARIGKSVSIVHTSTGNVITTSTLGGAPITTTTPSMQFPALQQHQSIIQQHIVSGPADKRQLIGSHRPVEIKETIITQTTPKSPYQQHLNSQTIITKQPQQHMVVQPGHSSIIQQKMGMQQTQQAGKITKVQPQMASGTTLPTVAAVKKPLTVTASPSPAPAPRTTAQIQPVSVVKDGGATTVGGAGGTLITTTPQGQVKPQLPTVQQEAAKEPAAKPESKTVVVSTTATTSSVPTTMPTPTTPVPSRTPTPTATAPPPTPQLPVVPLPPAALPVVDPNWLYVCDWRNCPRRKYKSANDLQHHACIAHCPDHLDAGAEIFCQWGPGPGLCDGVPRKRFSLMTHIMDRHLTVDSLRAAVQRRIATGAHNVQPSQPPVTIVRNVTAAAQASNATSGGEAAAVGSRAGTASPALSPSGSSVPLGSSALQAIKRHTADFVNAKELMDENEGPVTKSIRLTAALILRNLVTYTTTAKRTLRQYEAHLASVGMSNVESSGAISHILFELQN